MRFSMEGEEMLVLQGDTSNFSFFPHFVRGLFWLVVSLLVFSIQRLFNSWYKWAHRAPLMPFRICLKGSRPWMPDNKTPPSTWTYKSSCLPLTVVHHRTFSSKPASKGANQDMLRTNSPEDNLQSFNYFLSFVLESETHYRPDPKFREIPR